MREALDETKITDYALGVLAEAERVAVERLIAGSEEARGEVEEIRAMEASLREAFGSISRHELTPEQRSAIEAVALRTPAASPRPARRSWRTPAWAALAAAAVLVVALAVPVLHRDSRYRYQRAPAPAPPATIGVLDHFTVPRPRSATSEEMQQLRSLGYICLLYTSPSPTRPY